MAAHLERGMVVKLEDDNDSGVHRQRRHTSRTAAATWGRAMLHLMTDSDGAIRARG